VEKVLRRRGHRVEQALTVATALDLIERDRRSTSCWQTS